MTTCDQRSDHQAAGTCNQPALVLMIATVEREKYAGGIGSIVDILSIEDRLTGALADQVQSELA